MSENIKTNYLHYSLTNIWQLLSYSERELLRNNNIINHFKKNEVIFIEGENPKYLMFLLKGKVKIYKNGVGGRSQIIKIIRPEQFFGYRSYFSKESYLANASAFEYCDLCMIPLNVVDSIIASNSNIARLFINLLSSDLGICYLRVVNLTQKHIRGRLAESLLFLKENYGLEEDGATINIYLGREDLASFSNMTTSNAIRTLSMFVDERILTIDGRKIKIIDEDRLLKISKIG